LRVGVDRFSPGGLSIGEAGTESPTLTRIRTLNQMQLRGYSTVVHHGQGTKI
jgi:hypothetical protein